MTTRPTSSAPITLRTAFTGAYLLPTVILVLGIGMHATNVFVFATVMPSVVNEIGGHAYYSWATTFFIMASIVGATSAPLAKGALGPRLAFTSSTLLFALGSLGCALAPDMNWMIFSRIVQGTGGGLVVALGYTVVSSIFPRALWAKVLTVVSGAWGVAALLGPIMGGIFAQIGFWRGAFFMVTAIAILVLAMATIALPKADPDARKATGVAASFGRLFLLAAAVVATSASGTVDATSTATILLLAGVVGLVAAQQLDTRAASPLLPKPAFSFHHPIGHGLWMIFLLSTAIAPIGVFIPLFVQVLHGVSPAFSGYFHALQALSWTGAALLVSSLTAQSVRRALVLGPLCVAMGLGLIAASITGPSLTVVGIGLVISGSGVGMCWAHISTTILGAATDRERDHSSSAIPTVQLLGLAVGSALAGVVVNLAGGRTSLAPEVVGPAAWILFLLFVISGLAATLAGSALRRAV